MRRWAARTIAVVALVLGGVGLSAGAASAHSLRQSSQPDAGAELATSPPTVAITFGETPDPRVSSIRVLDTAGHDHTTGHAAASATDAHTLTVAVGHLPNGVYTVAWRTLSLVDGHTATGTFAFGVGAAPTGTSASAAGSSSTTTPAGVTARWLLYSGLMVLVGAALLGATTPARQSRRMFPLLVIAWSVATIGVLAVAVLAQRAAGLPMSQLFRTSLTHQLAYRGVPLVVAGAVLGRTHLLGEGRPNRVALAVIGTAAMVSMAGDVAVSHAAAGALRGVHMAFQFAHFAAAGVWIGGLVALVAVMASLPAADRARTARRFSALALFAAAVVAGTGAERAIVEVRTLHGLAHTLFGQAVITKTVLLVVLLVLGGLNRYRTVPHAADQPRLLARLVRVEIAAAVVVLVATGVLQTSAPPASIRRPAKIRPLIVRGHDFATTVNVALTATPGTAGFNTFTARVTDYDTAAPVTDATVALRFALPARPDLGEITLQLTPQGTTYHGRGAQLSLNGTWRVTVIVQRSAGAVEIPLELTPKLPHYKIDVTRASGLPDTYTIHIAPGLDVQAYLDPPQGGLAEFHATFLNGDHEIPARALTVTADGPGRDGTQPLTVRNLDGLGHYVADLPNPTAGRFTFTIAATTDQGQVATAVTIRAR